MNDTDMKMKYTQEVILPELLEAFTRGSTKYKGDQHESADHALMRENPDDIRHIRELHAEVRLREAEELATNGMDEEALKKITSAMGYLIILHRRVRRRAGIVDFKKSE